MKKQPGEIVIATTLAFCSLFLPISSLSKESVAGQLLETGIDPSKSILAIKQPIGEHVVFLGIANYDNAGIERLSSLYPAPNAGGFIAAIITHGFLASSAKQKQKEQIQEDANKALLSYKSVIDTFSTKELISRAITKPLAGFSVELIDGTGDYNRETVIENQPIFMLTPDQMAIILDNTITIRLPHNSQKPSYQNSIRIVLPARELPNPIEFWTKNNGENIKEESAKLFAESLIIALQDAVSETDSTNTPYRTIRYRIGSTEKIERAQVLNNHCGQLLIRTLRGTLMSVPSSATEATHPEEPCISRSLRTRLDNPNY